MNITDGYFAFATANSAYIIFYDSPNHLEVKIPQLTLKNEKLFHSDATAFAIIVFPFPGGPNNKIPFTGSLIPVKN